MGKFIQNASPALIGNEEKYVIDCLRSNWISSLGEYISRFEKQFAKFHGAKFAISCNSGTAALHAALLALGVGKGDEVIAPALTFVATINAITYCGAKPVLVDIDQETWCIDPNEIKRSVSSRTKGIIPVHLFGHPADMGSILGIAKKNNLFVLEDNAQGLGSLYKGRKTGTIGDMGTFSFFGSKLITTGEGGMMLTNNSRLAKQARLFKHQGMEPKKRYWFPVVGYNYRMTNIAAAIGLAQLEKIKIHIKKRREVAMQYLAQLHGVEDIGLPIEKDYAFNVYWMFNIYLKNGNIHKRDFVIRELLKAGIEARYVSFPISTLPPYRKLAAGKKFPVAEDVCEKAITLPTHENLSKKDITRITNELKKALKKYKN